MHFILLMKQYIRNKAYILFNHRERKSSFFFFSCFQPTLTTSMREKPQILISLRARVLLLGYIWNDKCQTCNPENAKERKLTKSKGIFPFNYSGYLQALKNNDGRI